LKFYKSFIEFLQKLLKSTLLLAHSGPISNKVLMIYGIDASFSAEIKKNGCHIALIVYLNRYASFTTNGATPLKHFFVSNTTLIFCNQRQLYQSHPAPGCLII